MSKPSILCVDDEKIVLDTLKEQLNLEFGNDYNIETAENGPEALNICRDLFQSGEEIPLIIADYVMPGMKGDELLKCVRELNPKVVSILLTGQATLEGVANALNLGNVFRYIAKPWEIDTLFSIVAEALEFYYGERSYEDKVDKLKAINSELQQTLAEKINELEQNQGAPVSRAGIDPLRQPGQVVLPRMDSLLLTIKSGIDMIHHQQTNPQRLEPENPPYYQNSFNEFFQITSAILGNLAETLTCNPTNNPPVSFDSQIVELVNGQLSTINRQLTDNLRELTNRITVMERQFSGNTERLAAWDDEEIVILDSNEVLFITSEDSQTFLVTQKAKYKMRDTLDILESRLDQKKFFRCHRSFIINLRHIAKVSPWIGNNSYLFKFAGLSYEIPVSRNRIKEMKRLLEIS